MKILIYAAWILFAMYVNAQEFNTAHYHVVSDISIVHATETAKQLEAFFSLYNQMFHFSTESTPLPMKVRIFAVQADFDTYLQQRTGKTYHNYVYLHYTDPAKNELVGYLHSEWDAAFVHQSFIQFFRAFIPNAPLWLYKGFAVYFENSIYDKQTDTAQYRQNLTWLHTLQNILTENTPHKPFSLHALLHMDTQQAEEHISVFYPQAWGMVHFLHNAVSFETRRLLWDGIHVMSAEASTKENAIHMYNTITRQENAEMIQQQFIYYIRSIRSFHDWVEYGIQQYQDNNIMEAQDAFQQALTLSKSNPVPYYYLGLTYYTQNDYDTADDYYHKALTNGAEQSSTLYALGVNAHAHNKFAEAIQYLEQSAQDPAYYEKAKWLLQYISEEE